MKFKAMLLLLIISHLLLIENAMAFHFKIGPIKFSHNPDHNPITSTITCTKKAADDTAKVVTEAADAAIAPVKSALEGAKQVVEDTVEGAVNLAKAAGNVGEIAANLVTGDTDSAESARDRLKDNGHDAVAHIGAAGETAARTAYDVAIEAPVVATATILDETITNGKLTKEYYRFEKRTSAQIKRTSQKIGAVLNVAIQPENIGKIAFLYAASAVGGPFGSALANVLYDKIVLKKQMSRSEMLKSFAIGAAAGYAAENVQGAVEGKKAVDAAKQASYLSKMASGLTKNLTTDLGHVTLNHSSYSSKDLLNSILTSASVVEVGDNSAATIIESTLDSALTSTTEQVVENDFNMKKVDFSKVEMALYQGMANGVTQEAVHKMMDATIMNLIPDELRRFDKKAIDELGNVFYEAILAYQNYCKQEQDLAVLNALLIIDENERQVLFDHIQEKQTELNSTVSQQIFGRPFSELTAKEILSDDFKNSYQNLVNKVGLELIKNNPTFASLIEVSEEAGRNPAETAKIIEL